MANDLIPAGSKVTATLSLDQDSAGSAELFIVDADHKDATTVSASGSVSITPKREGQLRVVITAAAGTTGRLTVEPGGVSNEATGGNHEERFTVAEFGE